MYFVEHKEVASKYGEVLEETNKYLAQGNSDGVKQFVQHEHLLKESRNKFENWQYFWDSITTAKDKNGQPFLPHKNSELYRLI